MSSSSVAPVESSIKKHKRVRVKKACTNCRLAKTCCSASRPCIRCSRLGLEANCRDLTPQGAEDMVSSSSTPLVLSEKEVQDVELMKQYVGGYRPASASDVSRNQTGIPVPYDWVMSSVLNGQHVPAPSFSHPQHPPLSLLSSSNRSVPDPAPSPSASFPTVSAPFALTPASSHPVSSISSNIQYYQHYQQQQQQQQQGQQQQPQQQAQQQPQFFQQQQQQQQSQGALTDSTSSSASSSGCPLEMSDFSSTTVFDTDARNETVPAESHEDSFAPNSPPGVVPSADSPDISAPSDMRCPNEPTPAYFMRRFINQQQKQRQEEQKQQQKQQQSSSQSSQQQQQNPQESFPNNPVGLNAINASTSTTMSGSSISAAQMADVSSYVKQDPSYSLSLSAINSSNVIGSGPCSTSLKDSPSSVCTAHTTTTPAYFGMVGTTEDQMIMLPPNVVREIELLRNENLSLRDKVSQLMYKLEISRLSNSSWYRDTLMTNPAHLAYSTWLFPTSVLLDYNDYFFENLRPELKPLAKARQMTCKVLFLPRHTPKCTRILTWLGKGLARYLEVEQLWWKDDREIAVISSVRIHYNDEGHPVRLDMISQHRPHVLVPPVDSPEYDRFFTPLAVEAPALEHLFQLASQEQERSPHLTPKAITDASPFFSIDPCRSFADS